MHPLNYTAARESSPNYLDDIKPENCFVCLTPNCVNESCFERLETLKERMDKLIFEIESNADLSNHLAICGQTGFISTIHKSYRKDIFNTWEFFSGSFFNPVPNPNNEPLYSPEQKKLRLHCAKYINKYLYEDCEYLKIA